MLHYPLTVSVQSKGDDQIVKITDEVPFVVRTGANTSVDVPIPVRVFRVALKRSLCQLPDVVSYLFYVVSLTTDFRFCFPVEVCAELRVRLGVRLRQL